MLWNVASRILNKLRINLLLFNILELREQISSYVLKFF